MARDLEKVDLEGLHVLYLELDSLRIEEAAFLAEQAERTRKLSVREHLVLGSLESARAFLEDEAEDGESTGSPDIAPADAPEAGRALATRAEFSTALTEAKTGLATARAELEGWIEAERERLETGMTELEARIAARVESFLEGHVPRLHLEVAPVAGGRTIVHCPRPEGDEAILLCGLLAGRPPSHYSFLTDDAVDRPDGQVNLLYASPGLDPDAITDAGPEALEAVVDDETRVLLPVRGWLPIRVPGVEHRWRFRGAGPVLELECRNPGERYEHILEADVVEELTGFLVSLRVRGRLEVEVEIP